MSSELEEVENEIKICLDQRWNFGKVFSYQYFNIAKEVIDLRNSCQTMLEILRRTHGVDIAEAEQEVFQKNNAPDRRYYDENTKA